MNMGYTLPLHRDKKLQNIEDQIKEIQNFIQITHTKINQRGLCRKAEEWGWTVVSGSKRPYKYKAVRSGWGMVILPGDGKKNLKTTIASDVLKSLATPVLAELDQKLNRIKQQQREKELEQREKELADLQLYVHSLEEKISLKEEEVNQLIDELVNAEKDTEVSLELALEIECKNLALIEENANLNRSLTDLMKERVERVERVKLAEPDHMKHKVGQLMQEKAALEQKMLSFATQYEGSIQWLRNFASKLPFGLGQELLNHLNILESGNLGILGSKG